jgi:hypothetical protein
MSRHQVERERPSGTSAHPASSRSRPSSVARASRSRPGRPSADAPTGPTSREADLPGRRIAQESSSLLLSPRGSPGLPDASHTRRGDTGLARAGRRPHAGAIRNEHPQFSCRCGRRLTAPLAATRSGRRPRLSRLPRFPLCRSSPTSRRAPSRTLTLVKNGRPSSLLREAAHPVLLACPPFPERGGPANSRAELKRRGARPPDPWGG